MLKFLLGSRPSRRIRQSQMVTTAQVSVLEKRELLDGETGYGSYDPYGDGGSGSCSCGTGEGEGTGSGSSSGSGGSSETGSIVIRPQISPGSNSLSAGAETGSGGIAPFTWQHELFSSAAFYADVTYTGSNPRIRYTATNGGKPVVWIGDSLGGTFPVGSGTGVTVTGELLNSNDEVIATSDPLTIGVVTFSLTGRSVAAAGGFTEGVAQSNAEAYLRTMSGPVISDIRSNLTQFAVQLDGADPRPDLWQTQLPILFDDYANNGVNAIVSETNAMIASAFKSLDAGLNLRVAVSNPYLPKALELRDKTASAIEDFLDQHPVLDAIQLDIPSAATFHAALLEAVSDGNPNDFTEILKRSVTRVGVSLPYDWTDSDNNLISGSVGASATRSSNTLGQTGWVYDVRGGISSKRYQLGDLTGQFDISGYFRDAQGVILQDEGWGVKTYIIITR